MSVRSIRQACWVLVAACGVCAAAVLYLAAHAPLSIDQSADGSARRPSSSAAAADGGAIPLASFARLWDLDLRRSLKDAPPPAAPENVVQHAEAMPQFSLVGTVVEPGHSMAIFIENGKTRFVAIGSEIAGARLLAVEESGATLNWNNKTLRVPITRAKASPPALIGVATTQPAEPSADSSDATSTDNDEVRPAGTPNPDDRK